MGNFCKVFCCFVLFAASESACETTNPDYVVDIPAIGVTSIGWSSYFDSYKNISWLIKNSNFEEPILFSFSWVYISVCPMCSCNYVAIYDGPNEQSSLLTKYCALESSTNMQITTSKPVAFVRFSTTSQNYNGGFNLRIFGKTSNEQATTNAQTTYQPPIQNVTVLTSCSGTIRYPEYGGYYDNNEDVAWQISPPWYCGSIVRLYLTYLDIERCYDPIYIYDGPSNSYPLIVRICNETSYLWQNCFTTRSSAMVRFTSDSSNVGRGFQLNFESGYPQVSTTAVQPEVTTAKTPTYSYACSGTIRYPENDSGSDYYNNNEDVSWIIDSSVLYHWKPFKLYLTFLDIEGCYDPIEIYDGPSLSYPRIVRICNDSQYLNQPFYTTRSSALIRFTSDSSNVGRGFRLAFQCGDFDQWTTEMPRPSEMPTTGVPQQFVDLIADESRREIKRPEDGSYYNKQAETIQWTIRRYSSYGQLCIVFSQVHMTPNDELKLYDSYGNLLAQFYDYQNSWNSGAGPYCVSYGQLYLHFRCDYHYDYRNYGFIAQYYIDASQTTAPPYGISTTPKPAFNTLNMCSGSIRHPEYGGFYDNNEDYSWQINSPYYGTTIKMYLTFLDVENCCDAIYIFDGPSTTNYMIAKINNDTNNYLYRQFYTTGRSALVRFISDYSNVGRGFQLIFECETETTTAVAMTTTPGIPTYNLNAYYYREILEHNCSNGRIENIGWNISPGIGGYSSKVCIYFEWVNLTAGYLSVEDRTSGYLLEKFYSGSHYWRGPFCTTSWSSGLFLHFVCPFSYCENSFYAQYYLDSGIETTTPAAMMTTTAEMLKYNINAYYYRQTLQHENSNGHIENIGWNISPGISGQSSKVCIYLEWVNLTAGNFWIEDRTTGGLVCHFYPGSYYWRGPFCTARGSSGAFLHVSCPFSYCENSFYAQYYLESGYTTTRVPETTTAEATTTLLPPNNPWPRGRDLLGFWPLDSINRLSDITGRQRNCQRCRGTLNSDAPGPFGQDGTSYSASWSMSPILDVPNARPGNNASFTVTFFVRVPANVTRGGIFSLGNFQIDLAQSDNRPAIRIRGATTSKSDVYGVYDILQPDEWSFVSVVLEKSRWAPCMMSIHGRFGTIYEEMYKPRICETLQTNRDLLLGFLPEGQGLSSDIELSCLTLYGAALSQDEIREVHHACRAAHGTPPCGSPIVPYPAIPTPSTTTPKYGQFPWIASLRKTSDMNSVVCSATIIDRFFLLTSASCFKADNSPRDFVVRVGDFDAIIMEPDEKEHNVRHVFVYPFYNESFGDLAIIELQTPIDFHDDYVNTMCLPKLVNVLEDRSVIRDESNNYYVFGWGINGRLSLVSKSSPRYVTGTSETCPNQHYNLTTCFQSKSKTALNVPCKYDEGGPLMAPGTDILENDLLHMVGIYSKRSTDCSPSTPAVFTLIAPYMQWITKTIACALPGYSYPVSCPINNA